MTDDFSSSSIDTDKWLTGTNSGNLSSIVNGELNLESSGSGQGGWVVTDKSYTPKNSTVTIKVSQANDDGNLAISPTYDLSSTTGIYNQTNYYQFYTYRSGGTGSYQLYAQWKKNGTLGDQNITGSLNITGTVWLRLRFDDTTIYFEASLDGTTWSTQYSETFDLPGYTLDDAFHYQLCAYNTPSKGEWLCDDFAIESTTGGGTTEVTLLNDDFSDSSIDTDTWYVGTNSGNQSAISSGELNLVSSGSGQSGWVITKDAFTAENTTVTVKITQPNDDGNLAITPTYDLSSPTGIYNQNNI